MFCCKNIFIFFKFVNEIFFLQKLQNDSNYIKRRNRNNAIKYAAVGAGVAGGVGLGAFALSSALNSNDGGGDIGSYDDGGGDFGGEE